MARRVCLLVVVGALLGGCSDDGGGGDSRAAEQQQFVAAADAVCAGFYERTREVLAPIYESDPPDAAAAAELPGWLSYARRETDQLSAITAPGADAAVWADVVADLRAGLDVFEPALTAARAGDGAGLVAALDSGFASFGPVDQRMRDLGLQVCGSAE